MWGEAVKILEDLLSNIAIIITGVGSVILAVRHITKAKDDSPEDDEKSIVQGQSVPVEEPWLTDLRETNAVCGMRLEKAITRLAQYGLPYEDI